MNIATRKLLNIQGVTLNLKKHPSLKEPSIVEKRAIFGKKGGGNYKPIHARDLEPTGDMLKGKELRIVRKGIQNDTKEHRESYEKTKNSGKKVSKNKKTEPALYARLGVTVLAGTYGAVCLCQT